MAISFVAAGTVNAGTLTNPTPVIPAGYAVGDLLIAVACNDVTANYGSPPAGWTQLINLTGAPTLVPMQIIYKVATSTSETNPTFSQASANTGSVVVVYRGTQSFDPNTYTAQDATNVSSHTANGITTTTANEYVLRIFGSEARSASTWGVPSGTTARVNYSGASTTTCPMLIVDELVATAGATANRTATSSQTEQCAIATIGLIEYTANGDFFFMFS